MCTCDWKEADKLRCALAKSDRSLRGGWVELYSSANVYECCWLLILWPKMPLHLEWDWKLVPFGTDAFSGAMRMTSMLLYISINAVSEQTLWKIDFARTELFRRKCVDSNHMENARFSRLQPFDRLHLAASWQRRAIAICWCPLEVQLGSHETHSQTCE